MPKVVGTEISDARRWFANLESPSNDAANPKSSVRSRKFSDFLGLLHRNHGSDGGVPDLLNKSDTEDRSKGIKMDQVNRGDQFSLKSRAFLAIEKASNCPSLRHFFGRLRKDLNASGPISEGKGFDVGRRSALGHFSSRSPVEELHDSDDGVVTDC